MICFLICYVMFSSFSFYLFYYHYYYFFFPFFLFFYYTSCTLFPTNKPLHPQCRRLIILEYEGELYRVEVDKIDRTWPYYVDYFPFCTCNSNCLTFPLTPVTAVKGMSSALSIFAMFMLIYQLQRRLVHCQ